MAGYPLKDDELEDIRRRLADVLSCDDAVWEDEADVFNEMTRKGLA